jgi:hypothetical protein
LLSPEWWLLLSLGWLLPALGGWFSRILVVVAVDVSWWWLLSLVVLLLCCQINSMREYAYLFRCFPGSLRRGNSAIDFTPETRVFVKDKMGCSKAKWRTKYKGSSAKRGVAKARGHCERRGCSKRRGVAKARGCSQSKGGVAKEEGVATEEA